MKGKVRHRKRDFFNISSCFSSLFKNETFIEFLGKQRFELGRAALKQHARRAPSSPIGSLNQKNVLGNEKLLIWEEEKVQHMPKHEPNNEKNNFISIEHIMNG